jgi:signal transduction histidine kinase
MFRSARVKLTLFYLAALLVFSLSVTGTIRVLAEREYNRSNDVQRSEVRQLFLQHFFGMDRPMRPDTFYDVQAQQEELVRQHLNQELIIINIVALVLGGWLSYWFAGRTLKPIEEAHETQARFAADASHELRTPLTNMRLENEVFLRQKGFSEAEARGLIKSNLEEVQRLENLAASLLDLTQYGKASLELSPVSVLAIVDQATQRVAAQTKAKHAHIVKHIASDKVLADHHSLAQMLATVLDNALKYGSMAGTVTVEGTVEDDQYVLRVLDEGLGIDEADLPLIFDRLYRGDKARSSKTGGYGLGLALAREIAQANHATITASNREQGGACLEIRLNLAR